MKLKNTNYIARRTLAFLAMIATSQAATIIVDATTGGGTGIYSHNALVDNGANTVQANLGGNTLNFGVGSSLTATGAPAAVNVTAIGYTLNNNGSLFGTTAGAVSGVTVAAQATLNNWGTMQSANGQGVNITAGTVSSVYNYAQIQGSVDGLKTVVGVNLTNYAGGIITGATTGVNATIALNVDNFGTITATAAAGNAVLGTTGAIIRNNTTGVITGGADGVQVTTGATITNEGLIRGSAVSGGDGVQLADGTITNTGTGVISGADRGIRFLATGAGPNTVNNSGGIGSVSGYSCLVGIDFLGTASVDTLNMNAGTLSGTTAAVNFGPGDDVLNFRGGTIAGGSPVTYAVDGGAGVNDTINFNLGPATLNGNVINFESINRNGIGVAAINGSTVADRIQVTAGTLLLNGNVNPSTAAETAITLNAGGTLGGTGVWKASLTQTAGILSPGGAAPMAVDTLTLSNDLIVTGGSLLVNMNPVTQTNDVLNVTRSANINGATILISPTTKDAPLQNASTRVLDMSGTRTGQYAAAGFFFETGSTDGGNLVATSGTGAFVSSTVSLNVVDGTDVRDQNVSVVHHYHTVPGLSAFGAQFGAALNNRVAETLNNSNPVLADFLGFLDYSDGATVAATLNSYEAAYLQSSMASMVVSAREIHRIVEQQNAGDRLFPSDAHAWVNFNYNDLSNTGSSSRYTLGGGGVIDGIHIGALISQGYADISNSSDISTLSYGVYLGTGAATEWQVNAYFGGSNGKTNINRNISVFSQADPEGQGMQGVLSGAYMMEQGSCLWGPTFGIEYSSATMDRNSITPSANLPAMSFDADKLESFRLLLGGRADFNFDSNIRPYVSAQWAHEFIGDSDGYRATFQGGSFNVNTPYSLATDAVIIRAGIVVGLGKSWFGDLGYMGEYSINGDGEDFSGVNLGLRASF